MRMRITGRVRIEIDGKLVYEGPNLITNAGFSAFAGLFNGIVTTPFTYIALGTGTDPADVLDVALEAERTTGGAARVQGDTSRITTVVTEDTAQVQAEFTITADFDLSEMGLLDSAVAGILAAHRVFPAITVLNGQSLLVTWTLRAGS